MTRFRARVLAGAALLLGSAAAWSARQGRTPSACPYSQRFFLDLPRPFPRRDSVLELLAPAAGERVLGIGPGMGYYSLAVARALGPGGCLGGVDLQQEMLDELMRRAEAAGVTNIDPIQEDAQALPFPDAAFDAAFLVATLGEIPDRERGPSELRRVLKPGGRLVVGEGQPDPHHVRIGALRPLAERTGLRYAGHRGGRPGYVARFVNEGDGVIGC